jgi:GcrA cell cycle regulator
MSEKRDWTEAEFAVLRGLWAEGLSASAIGGRMGRTKNSVLGCVHRLTLPGRASPIAAKGSGVAPKQQRRAALLGVGKVRGENSLAGGTLAALGVVPAGEVRLAPEPVAPKYAGVSRPCCWPIGEPRAKGFRFSDAAGVPGRPYCAEHCDRAYVAPAVRSEASVAADEARRAAAHARMARGGGFPVVVLGPEFGG